MCTRGFAQLPRAQNYAGFVSSNEVNWMSVIGNSLLQENSRHEATLAGLLAGTHVPQKIMMSNQCHDPSSTETICHFLDCLRMPFETTAMLFRFALFPGTLAASFSEALLYFIGSMTTPGVFRIFGRVRFLRHGHQAVRRSDSDIWHYDLDHVSLNSIAHDLYLKSLNRILQKLSTCAP